MGDAVRIENLDSGTFTFSSSSGLSRSSHAAIRV